MSLSRVFSGQNVEFPHPFLAPRIKESIAISLLSLGIFLTSVRVKFILVLRSARAVSKWPLKIDATCSGVTSF
jgi:hypothetical protein